MLTTSGQQDAVIRGPCLTNPSPRSSGVVDAFATTTKQKLIVPTSDLLEEQRCDEAYSKYDPFLCRDPALLFAYLFGTNRCG